LTFVYSLPVKLNPGFFDQNKEYSLVLQKQAGAKQFEFKHLLSFTGRSRVWSTPNVLINNETAQFIGDINSDAYWALIFSE
jgi:hypothetical protein